jgi:hypothetical protein
VIRCPATPLSPCAMERLRRRWEQEELDREQHDRAASQPHPFAASEYTLSVGGLKGWPVKARVQAW